MYAGTVIVTGGESNGCRPVDIFVTPRTSEGRMVNRRERSLSRQELLGVGRYERPRVEQVLTATDLGREILQAQIPLSQEDDPV